MNEEPLNPFRVQKRTVRIVRNSVEKVACTNGAALIHSLGEQRRIDAMMGEQTGTQEALFYGFSLERHVPSDHMLRSIDRFVDLGDIRERLKPFTATSVAPRSIPSLCCGC